MRISRLIGAVLFALSCAENMAAQSNPPQATPPVSPVTVSATIYITAATKKGILVTDLKPEDLAIMEDKVPAKIEQVSCGRDEPILVGILVDVSGSRRIDTHLSSHYDALVSFLDSLLTADDATYLAAFDDKIYKLSEVMTDRAAISEAFDKLRKHEPHGSTALYDAVKAVAEANFFGRKGRRVLVVVGDWEDNTSHITMYKAAEAPQRSSTTIYALVDDEFGASKKAHKLAMSAAVRITEETGGLAYDVHEKEDFGKALRAIGGAVVGSCRVEYTTTGNAGAKKGTKLHVEASSKDVSILYPRVRFSSAQ
ncbi:MAG: hypothetical protein DMG35_01340 [Acidobacteria bacterium]|nr:MAG: hypothetical protein AUH86_19155 [Acidobacteria bacterium 13_1_40CM_4_58_4]PYT64188.1 MAG: hypothetical protein DMG35_01340 [Acidobacteriota bacterium]